MGCCKFPVCGTLLSYRAKEEPKPKCNALTGLELLQHPTLELLLFHPFSQRRSVVLFSVIDHDHHQPKVRSTQRKRAGAVYIWKQSPASEPPNLRTGQDPKATTTALNNHF